MKYAGSGGVVKADVTGGTPAAVGNVSKFDIEESCDVLAAAAMGDTHEDPVAGILKFSGTIDAYYDPADAQLILLRAGTIIDFELIPESGFDFTGTALVTNVKWNVDVKDTISVSITLEGKGALTFGAVV